MRTYSSDPYSATMRVARVILATTLLLGILASSYPLTTIATGPMCKLACCAGRAPHGAGSCMNDSCPAFLETERKTFESNHHLASHHAEPMCGFAQQPMLGKVSLITRALNNRANNRKTADQYHSPSKIYSASLGRPCQPGCGSCISASSNSNRERYKATLGFADQLYALAEHLVNDESCLIQKRNQLCLKCVPRAPPVSES
jgi:hypothetical protein